LLQPKKNTSFWSSLKKVNALDVESEERKKYVIDTNYERDIMESISSGSPFRHLFSEIKNNIPIGTDNLNCEQNNYHNKSFCDFILKKYCAFLPFWTNIMGSTIESAETLVSNAPVENRFLIQKRYVMDGRINSRPGDFIKETRKNSISILKELRLKYGIFSSETSDANINGEDHAYSQTSFVEEPEEAWNKKNQVKREGMNTEKMHAAKKLKKCWLSQQNVTIQPNPEINSLKVNASQNKFHILDFKKEYELFGQAPADAVGFYTCLVQNFFIFWILILLDSIYNLRYMTCWRL